jgi:hypothetical protein
MGRSNSNTNPASNSNQAELPLFICPTVIIPPVKIPQPDGSILIKAGKPVIVEEEIGIAEAAKILGLSVRHLEYQCSIGLFKTAYKPGGRPRSQWRIARSEVLERKNIPSE